MKKNIFIILFIISFPILLSFILYPDTFSLSWNQGRGGFLFSLIFVIAELFNINIIINKKQILLSIIPLVLITIYLILLDHGLHNNIENMTSYYNIQLISSWLWMWDFIIMTFFFLSIILIFFGIKKIKLVSAAPIFLAGNSVILFLDAFFPYDSLGPLQYIVPYLVKITASLISYTDIGIAIARDNLLFLNGDHGPFALQVFWPSAGVHSIIIYSLVMLAFLIKTNINSTRKLMYFFIGIIGTIFINMIRLFLLSFFVLKISSNGVEFEEFHSVAGEIIFIPWLIIFLITVTAIESKRLKKISVKKTL